MAMAAVSRHLQQPPPLQQRHHHQHQQQQQQFRPSTSAGPRRALPGIGGGGGTNSISSCGIGSGRSAFPSLPGFSRDRPQTQQGPRSQSLNFVNGFMMVNSPLPSIAGQGGSSGGVGGKGCDGFLSLSPPSSPSEYGGTFTIPGGTNTSHDRPHTASSSLLRPSTSPNDVSGRYSFYRQRADRSNNHRSLPFCPSSRLPAFLEHDRRVLLFHAYYEEDVLESPVESKRIAKCEIYFFVEDGTIEIVQTKQENSGIPHGVFLRRSRVKKPMTMNSTNGSGVGSSQYYEVDDLKIGNQVEIYCRTFHIVDCNESTRKYVTEAQGWHEVDVAPLPFPPDNFAKLNQLKMSRESGVPGIDRKRKMNDLKQVMECMLGKPTTLADRGAFLECGQDTLCFHVVWDDRKRLYGDRQCFTLLYYLADDTFEILPLHDKNDGRDQFPKLLKRCKLPRPHCEAIPTTSSTSGGFPKIAGAPSDPVTADCSDKYYTWRDLVIGKQVSIFGRSMLLARCDKFSRDHLASKGVAMGADLPLKPEEVKIRVERMLPPYNGFGSEEDSLRSCTGLHSPPPKKDLVKLREKSGVVLRFNAHMLSDKVEDHSRRFVIQFFMEDDTLAIREPPIANSGVMGGNFLRRHAAKKPDGSRYQPKDLYVGNVIDISGHRFVLLNADECSYRLMESDNKTFPYSDFLRLRESLSEKRGAIANYFVSDYSGDGKIDRAELEKCLRAVGLQFKKQSIITLWRNLDKRGKGKVSFSRLIKAASSPSGEVVSSSSSKKR